MYNFIRRTRELTTALTTRFQRNLCNRALALIHASTLTLQQRITKVDTYIIVDNLREHRVSFFCQLQVQGYCKSTNVTVRGYPNLCTKNDKVRSWSLRLGHVSAPKKPERQHPTTVEKIDQFYLLSPVVENFPAVFSFSVSHFQIRCFFTIVGHRFGHLLYDSMSAWTFGPTRVRVRALLIYLQPSSGMYVRKS